MSVTLTLDIFGRKTVAADVHGEESAQLAGPMVEAACEREHVNPKRLTLHLMP
jgi:hypothetical protein